MPFTRHAAPRLALGPILLVLSAASLGLAAKTAPKRAGPNPAATAEWKAPALADPESASAYAAPPAQWPGFPMLPDGRFPIAGYGGPIPAQTGDFRYAEFAAAGFTIDLKQTYDPGLVESNLQRLRVGLRHNLWTFVHDNRIIIPGRAYATGWRAEMDNLVATYEKEPGLLGYFLADEPEFKQYPNFAAINQHLARRDPTHPGFVDFMGFPGPGVFYGHVPYTTYLRRYIDQARPALFAVDSYPLHQKSDFPYYVTGWDSVAYVSRQTGVPFWAILLSSPYLDQRVATTSEMAWQAFLPMAYGARGIVWYQYWNPKPTESLHFHDAPITYDGRRTATYGRITDVNARIQALGQEMGRWEWLGTRHVGTLPYGCRAFVQANGLRVQSTTPLTTGL